MNILRGISIAGLVTVALMAGSVESLGQECDNGGSHTIQVNASGDGSPTLSYRSGSAEAVHVCMGDTVRWVLTGSDRSFFVNFFSGGPFAGAAKLGSSSNAVSITIGGGAQRGQSYSYGVEFADGGAIDPHIIVD